VNGQQQYIKAVLDKTYQVVKCDDEEMEKERNNLLSGIFDSGLGLNHTPKHEEQQQVIANGGKHDTDYSQQDKHDAVQVLVAEHDDHDNAEQMEQIEVAYSVPMLPSIKSCIEKQSDLTEYVEIIDSNDEENGSKSHHKRRHSSSKQKKSAASTSKPTTSSSSSRRKTTSSSGTSARSRHHEKSAMKHSRSKPASSTRKKEEKRERETSTVDLMSSSSADKKISGTSCEAKKLLKDAKEKIGHFARKHLSKALQNVEYDKEEFKNIAKKVTNKVFEDYRKKFKQTKSVETLNYEKFMATKRKRKIEELIKAYIARDITDKK